MIKICPNCNKEFRAPRKTTKFCGKICYSTFPVSNETRNKMSASGLGKSKPDGFGEKISKSTKDKPKPWLSGENNPNYGGKAVNLENLRIAAKKRGLAWSEETKNNHSKKMLGDSNWMRGKTHSIETIDKIKETIKNKYIDGEFSSFTKSISKAERELHNFLSEKKIIFISQFIIHGNTHRYDIYIPHINLIIEYYGDYWHGNPAIYELNKLLGRGTNKYLASDKWKCDEIDKKFALSNGYDIEIIWEHDFNKNKLEVLEKIIKLCQIR